MPFQLRAYIFVSLFFPFAVVVLICSLLSNVDESIDSHHVSNTSHVYVNGTGSSMMANTYWRSLAMFSTHLKNQKASYIVDSKYISTSSGVGKSDFSNGYSLFSATDSDVSKADLQYYLPDNGSRYSNTTGFTSSKTYPHLGSIMIPTIAGAMGIVYNIQGFPTDVSLVLDGSVLGDIFCGAITWWNDTAIQRLNPNVSMPAQPIKGAGRGDSSGSTQIFTTYLAAHSFQFAKRIGVSSQPKWPAVFLLGNSAVELIYISSSVVNSITYIPMEAIVQAKSIGQDPQVVTLLNNGTKILPTTGAVTVAIQRVASDTPFSRHNFLTILDVKDPKAYPIALMSFVLLRENYFWFTPGSETDCERVKALVYFWYYFLTDPDVVETNLNNGWVSISGDLLQDNMRALSLITCNRKNVMDELTVELKRQAFYIGRDSDYDWDYSLDFWSNNLKFETSKYGSTLYVLFYIILILVNATPFTTNMIQYFRKTSSQIEQDEVEVEKTFSQTGSFLNVLAENDIEEDVFEKDTKTSGRVNFTIQNQLAIYTQFITCFQILYICLKKSDNVHRNQYLYVISYLGIIPDWLPFGITLGCLVFVWIACMLYTAYFYNIIREYYPRKLLNMTHFHAILADFLPNYAIIFYNPSIELLAKAVECRLNPEHMTYISAYETICWTRSHWIMSVVSLVLVAMFTNFVVRYSKILKLLRKHFDFKDEEWYIYVDSVAKTFIIILYFNVPNEYFLPITMSLLIGIALCSLLGKPNEIFWYNYFRGGMYVYCAIVCLVLFVLELKVSKTDYDLREYLCYTISISVLGSTIILSVASYLHLTRKYKAGMTDGEIKLKEEELQKFFAAFGNDEKAGSKSEIRRNRSLTQSSTTASTLDNVEGVKNLSVPPETKNTSFSKLQWNQLDTMIVSARSINLLTQDEVKAIRLAIKYEDPMIVLVFERSDRELHKFVEGLKVKVFQALAKGPNDRGTRLYSCQMPLISPITEKKQVNTVV